jgi:exosortase A-associated hydrolase 1
MKESVLGFDCEGERLVGILAEPEGTPAEVGVIIIVGGPQYRAGSHRQFTLLARHLAASGFHALRFDYRGMGDSTGEARDFLGVDSDIAAAIAALQAARPAVRRVVLWGLCDAASASLLYLDSHDDSRVQALCLVNPWARSAASLAKATVKHYYRRRLLQKEFWLKLASGKLRMTAIQTLVGNVRATLAGTEKKAATAEQRPFQERMLTTLRGTNKPCLLVLSSLDQTALEFVEYARTANLWPQLEKQAGLNIFHVGGADHTLSQLRHQQQMFMRVAEWMAGLTAMRHPSTPPQN